MKAVVAAFNQEKALVGAFSVITNLRMELFQALHVTRVILVTATTQPPAQPPAQPSVVMQTVLFSANKTDIVSPGCFAAGTMFYCKLKPGKFREKMFEIEIEIKLLRGPQCPAQPPLSPIHYPV